MRKQKWILMLLILLTVSVGLNVLAQTSDRSDSRKGDQPSRKKCGGDTERNGFLVSVGPESNYISIRGDGPETLATEILNLMRNADNSVSVEKQEFDLGVDATLKMAGVTYSLGDLKITKAKSGLCPPLLFVSKTPVGALDQWSVLSSVESGRAVVTLRPSKKDANTFMALLTANGAKPEKLPGPVPPNYRTKNILCRRLSLEVDSAAMCWLFLDLNQ